MGVGKAPLCNGKIRRERIHDPLSWRELDRRGGGNQSPVSQREKHSSKRCVIPSVHVPMSDIDPHTWLTETLTRLASPDFNLIKQAFSKFKAHLRKAAERTIHGLWDAIGRIIDIFIPQECAHYCANFGYDAD